MKRIFITASILVIALSQLQAQESTAAYSLSRTDIAIGAVSAGLFGVSLATEGSAGAQTPESSISRIDRMWMSGYSAGLDKAGTISACAALMLPAISAAGQLDNAGNLAVYGVMYAEAFLLTTALKDLIKDGVSRWRPYTYEESFSSPGDDDYHNSFPSGHTAYAFLGAAFLSTTFSAQYPDSDYRKAVYGLSYSVATLTALLRIASGEHFISDVAAGAVLGSLTGWLVPFLHRTGDAPLSISPVPSGFVLKFSY